MDSPPPSPPPIPRVGEGIIFSSSLLYVFKKCQKRKIMINYLYKRSSYFLHTTTPSHRQSMYEFLEMLKLKWSG